MDLTRGILDMAGFCELGLCDAVLRGVDALGYREPTPVQEGVIPHALAGRDVMACAQTGTGKTAAFVLPALDALSRRKRGGVGRAPRFLAVTPTRELAAQVEGVLRTVARPCGLDAACVIGGVDAKPQVAQLEKGVDALVGTPGRIIDLVGQGALDLSGVCLLVLDEADQMLDMGFLPQVRSIVDACPRKRQTMLFSATLEGGVERNLAHLLCDPVSVQASSPGRAADTVRQFAIEVDHRCKPDMLAALLREWGSERVIVFARTRRRVDSCVRRLRQAGFSADAIHSDRSQAQRKRSLQRFASGQVDILVATDVLARGIDVSNVGYVVNYDVPAQATDYVHRIGRTGRAGVAGTAFTFVTPETRTELAAIEKLVGRQIPRIEVQGYDTGESERALAAKAARKAARSDPELAQAAKEYEGRLKRRDVQSRSGKASGKGSAGRKRGKSPSSSKHRDSKHSNATARRQQHAGGAKGGSNRGASAQKRGNGRSGSKRPSSQGKRRSS